MPTLSFSCPACEKNYDRVKPDMVGHKVRCDCGFVFRLGSKEEKMYGVAEKLKQRRAAKERKAEMHRRASGSHSSDLLDDPSVLEPYSESSVLDGIEPLSPIGGGDLFADTGAGLQQIDSGANSPMANLFDEELPVAYANETSVPLDPQDDLLGIGDKGKAKAKKKKTKKRRSSQAGAFSPAGGIWTLVLALLGTPVLIGISYKFISQASIAFRAVTAREAVKISPETVMEIMCLGLLGLILSVLVISLLITGIVAISEIVDKKKKTGAVHMSAVIASIFVVVYLSTFIFNIAYSAGFAPPGKEPSGAAIAAEAGIGTVYLLVPVLIAMTGFRRYNN